MTDATETIHCGGFIISTTFVRDTFLEMFNNRNFHEFYAILLLSARCLKPQSSMLISTFLAADCAHSRFFIDDTFEAIIFTIDSPSVNHQRSIRRRETLTEKHFFECLLKRIYFRKTESSLLIKTFPLFT